MTITRSQRSTPTNVRDSRAVRRAAPVLAGLLVVLAAAGCGAAADASPASTGSSPGAAATTSAQGQVLPVDVNPIDTTTTGTGLVVDSVLVENNVDPVTGAAADDHLQVSLSNSGQTPLAGVELFYTVTDTVDGTAESYYAALPSDLTVDPGQATVVDVDTTGAAGHVPANAYGLYYTSPNAMDVEVMVSATGVAPQSLTVTKDAGGAETAD
ncbi:hypothetical protein [Jannaschia sp. R86511]|uniref:hypothetical protein n=1 Tax=Jannaschia sp. R86511 TaxID=3093853 RepID=UPI0036D27F6A